jgi:hypothetical protein
MKNAFVFWNVTPCTPGEAYQRFEGKCYLHFQGRRGGKYLYGGSMFVQNVSQFLTEYITSHPRRQYSSQSFPQEPPTLHNN